MIKILHLVLYSDDQYFNQMYDILNNFYKHYEDYDNNDFFVKTYYYKFNDTMTEDIEVIDNIINIKGDENLPHVPGILDKTLITFKYVEKEFQENNYDYIFRSNISTVVDFKLLVEELKIKQIEYYGALILGNLRFKDQYDNILDDPPILFAIGYNIILSNKGYNLLLNNIDLIDKTKIDDIAIGVLFDTLKINVELVPFKVVLPSDFIDYNLDDILHNKNIIYRNKNIDYDRDIDIKQMKIICKYILEQN